MLRRALDRPAGVGATSTPPAGFTLIEMVVVMTLGALVLALVGSVGLRLQRELGASSARIAGDEPLRDAAVILPLDLRAVSSSAGDIPSREARDTSLEIRATVASAIVCGAAGAELLLAPLLGARTLPTAGAINVGDTLWLLVDGDSTERWRPVEARSVRRDAGNCPPLSAGPANAPLFDVAHLVAVGVGDGDTSGVSRAFARVTRRLRYSFYRAGDGKWYMGLRTWNPVASRFNQIQPVSGPYASLSSGRLGLRYFDRAGDPVVSGAPETGRIARVEVILASDESAARRSHADSLHLVVALRNWH